MAKPTVATNSPITTNDKARPPASATGPSRCSEAAAPSYPITYDLGKALHAAGKARGEFGYGAHWAGQGAPLARPMPAAGLTRQLAREIR